jgi:hypothetical protein
VQTSTQTWTSVSSSVGTRQRTAMMAAKLNPRASLPNKLFGRHAYAWARFVTDRMNMFALRLSKEHIRIPTYFLICNPKFVQQYFERWRFSNLTKLLFWNLPVNTRLGRSSTRTPQNLTTKPRSDLLPSYLEKSYDPYFRTKEVERINMLSLRRLLSVAGIGIDRRGGSKVLRSTRKIGIGIDM